MRSLALLLSFVVVTAACTAHTGPSPHLPEGTLIFDSSGGQASLRVEIADTPDEQELGLMGRTHLAEDRGMAFVYEAPISGTFWMKDTLVPLSIGFWDESGRLVGILDMTPCTTEPCPLYGPDVPYVGAVEVNQGWFQGHGVQVGDRVKLRA